MSVRRRTGRRNKLEKVRSNVIVDLSVMTQEEVAAKYGVVPSSISEFVRRHKEEITEVHNGIYAEIEQETAEQLIAHKGWRIWQLQRMYNTQEEFEEEAVDLTELVLNHRMRSGLLRQAAEELGQLPRHDTTVNIDKAIIVRQLEGYTGDLG